MKATGIVALSLLGFAAAAPYKHFQQKAKRDLVWITETAEVVETVVATTTVWVDPTEAAQDYTTPTPEPTTTEEATTEETTLTTPTPEPTSTEAPATTEEPSTSSTSSTSVYTPPAPTTTSTPTSTPTPTPTSTYTPPATTEASSSTSTYVAPSSSEASSSAVPTKSAVVAAESSTGETFSPSRITYYSPSVGLGSCGQVYSDDSNVVALAAGNMNSDLCNKKLTIEVNGNQFGAFIGDTCPGCPSDGSLDITPTLFTKMMGSTDAGVITDAKWWWDE
ncbi:barwin-like endoglucanase [Diplodia corticola]|uniref:Barwin-like endoglucanase n=1 Tax=Diplodia corticola TaxID=236234 RepID=A0A1J9RMA5_9PEZI|nr:barwin-like endoglucanase [Diplodia corticola]OJD28733.1 barwin-like endoglucanase [Diplodia corticola]